MPETFTRAATGGCHNVWRSHAFGQKSLHLKAPPTSARQAHEGNTSATVSIGCQTAPIPAAHREPATCRAGSHPCQERPAVPGRMALPHV